MSRIVVAAKPFSRNSDKAASQICSRRLWISDWFCTLVISASASIWVRSADSRSLRMAVVDVSCMGLSFI